MTVFPDPPDSALWRARAAQRFQEFPPKVRIYARMKLRFDPMFDQLQGLLGLDGAEGGTRSQGCPSLRVLDVGAGYGVVLAWLLEGNAQLEAEASEPDPERAAVARRAFDGRVAVALLAAPSLPTPPFPVDIALLIDVAHYLDDAALEGTLQGIHQRLAPGGRLLLRDTAPRSSRISWERWIETQLMRWRRQVPHFRGPDELTARLGHAGFSVNQVATPGREETWFIARAV